MKEGCKEQTPRGLLEAIMMLLSLSADPLSGLSDPGPTPAVNLGVHT